MKLILGFLALGMLWAAFQGFYVSITNFEPSSISCADFAKNVNDKDWLDVKGCYIDNSGVVVIYNEKTGIINEKSDYYLFIRETESSDIFAYLKINSESNSKIYSDLFNLQEDDEVLMKFFDDNPDKHKYLMEAGYRDLKGLRLFGIDSDDADREVLQEYVSSEEFLIIDENEEPNIIKAIGLFIFGLVILFGLISTSKGKGKGNETPDEVKEEEKVVNKL